MQLALVLRTLGILLMLFSVSLIPPIVVSLIYQDNELNHFSITLAASLVAGLMLWLPFRRARMQMYARDGFIVVAMFWLVMGTLGSVPFLFGLEMDLADAVFESVSGYTTTGATVLTGLDTLPPSILMYRQEIQWLGGLGFIVLAVALLPMLGVGGMQLFRAETPGPMKEEKITPRITQTARMLWRIYLGLTVACAMAYWVAGMSAFDAIAHSLTTVSTAGFSTHDANLAFFNSPLIEAIAMVFMVMGAIHFAVHFVAMRSGSPMPYWSNPEVRAFFVLMLVLVAVVTVMLYVSGAQNDPLAALRYGGFEVVAVLTTTGYGIDEFAVWPLALPVIIIFASFVGGCAGSTAGGMKVIRFVLLWKQGILEVQRLVHPRLVRPIKLGERVVSPRVVDAVWAFFALYVAVFAFLMVVMMTLGMDQVTAFGAVASMLNNLGPALGEVSSNFAHVSDGAKWWLAAAMLLGRLELFTILVLFTPSFWRE